MRLINVNTLELEVRKSEPYAILSHTWGDNEVTFEEFGTSSVIQKAGYQKILQTCARAKKDGYQYVWIDTCCIDKRSSAELSETINSMFDWYRSSDVCYVLLEDVTELDKISHARWFTRGWTLQELLAPVNVIIFNRDWQCIGTRDDPSMSERLSRITGIDQNALQGSGSLDYIWTTSIATRMSWASKRKTTRDEDIAYCLFGLFDVNMPLLYGEGGQKAFRRLQEEIMKQSTDQSLLAWDIASQMPVISDKPAFIEVLAKHPIFFVDAREILPTTMQVQPFTMNNKGLQIRLRIIRRKLSRNRFIAILACFEGTLTGYIGIPIRSLQRDCKIFAREYQPIERVEAGDVQRSQMMDVCLLRTKPETRNPILSLQDTEFAFGFQAVNFVASHNSWNLSSHTVEVSSAQDNQYFGVVFKSDNIGSPLSVMALVHFLPGRRYTANVSIHDLLDQQDVPSATLAHLASAQPIKASRKTYTILNRIESQEVQLLVSIAWNYIAGRDTLVLSVQASHRSLSAQLINSSFIQSCKRMGIFYLAFICGVLFFTYFNFRQLHHFYGEWLNQIRDGFFIIYIYIISLMYLISAVRDGWLDNVLGLFLAFTLWYLCIVKLHNFELYVPATSLHSGWYPFIVANILQLFFFVFFFIAIPCFFAFLEYFY